MDEETKDRRVTSVGYVGWLLVFIGALGMYVEVMVISDNDVAKLMRDDPLGFMAPLTLLLLGIGALMFSLSARRSAAFAGGVVRVLQVALIVYGIVATAVVVRYALRTASGIAIAYSAGAAATLVGWIFGSMTLARYLRRLAS